MNDLSAVKNREANGKPLAIFDYNDMTPKEGFARIAILVTDKNVTKILSEPAKPSTAGKIEKEKAMLEKHILSVKNFKASHDKFLASLDYVKASAAGKLLRESEYYAENCNTCLARLEIEQVSEMKKYIADLEKFESDVREFFLPEIQELKKNASAELKKMTGSK